MSRPPLSLLVLPWLFSGVLVPASLAAPGPDAVRLRIPPPAEVRGLERLVESAGARQGGERVAYLAGYFRGRPYTRATRARVKRQRGGEVKGEATNTEPLPVEELPIVFSHSDCVTYTENVLALAFAEPDFAGSILPHLIDVRFAGDGGPLHQHQRNHFMSDWARRNVARGYLEDVTGSFPRTATRVETLNLRGGNRTYYVKDRFMIFPEPTRIRFVPSDALVEARGRLEDGDVLVFVRDIEGLDYGHVAFVVRRGGRWMLRHASYSKNRVVDQDLVPYLRENRKMLGATVLRPTTNRVEPVPYRFRPGPRPDRAWLLPARAGAARQRASP